MPADQRRKIKPSAESAKPALNDGSRKISDYRAVKTDLPNLVVGMGASAGGIDAFKSFFAAMPADSGMTFVLIQHLDPHHLSTLPAILASFTSMTVQSAENEMPIAPNHVYVIPPDAILTIDKGKLHLARPAPPADRRTSINTFLISLAKDQGDNAVGIILSGFGSDGALGIASIKEGGGLTLSQAEFDHHAKTGMPQSAASGGFVDHVLPVEKMPAALLNYQNHRSVFDAAKGPDGIRQDLPGYLPRVCSILHSRLGRDFSQYKAGTLMRRIQRRMHILQIGDVAAYVDRLRNTPDEAELLFKEFLISVTRFFRDPEAFSALDAIIASVLTGSATTDPIRVWVAGCATGEEAYSVAILLREALVRAESHRTVQIFATDIDTHAIEVARAGVYSEAISTGLSAKRLERNFLRESVGYRVNREIREMCVFSTHDLTSDPPFSRLDLICCRNLLIYFEPSLQHQVLTTFHYSLMPGGTLFLGPSESVTTQGRLFKPIDKRHRIFARKEAAASVPAFSISRGAKPEHHDRRQVAVLGDELERRASRVIARYTPAFLVVDQQNEVLRFSGQTSRYLEPASGAASLHLFSLLHPDLRTPVRLALKQVASTGTRVKQGPLNIDFGDQWESVNVIVEPLAEPGGPALFAIAFQDVGAGKRISPEEAGAEENGQSPTVQVLTKDLFLARERLRAVSEELDAATEDMQSSNEEYLSINEELQSANEELETSKEELQSLNEELQTINGELNNRNDSLMRSNSDLSNLFDSTSIATLFVDKDFSIRRFTPGMRAIFNLRDGDEGRPIGDIVSRLAGPDLPSDLRHVLETLVPVERELTLVGTDINYLMQVRPYRDLNKSVDGAVVTFVDVSERKSREKTQARLASIVESSQDAIVSHDTDGKITSWNRGAEYLYGYRASEVMGRSLATLLHDALPDAWDAILERLNAGEQIAQFETVRTAKDGQAVQVAVTISPIQTENGSVESASIIARDIGERLRAEKRSVLLLGELDHRVKNILAIVSAVVSQTLKSGVDPALFAAEIGGRIAAITKAHSLLTQSGQGLLSLRDILTTELAAYNRGDGNITLTGPSVMLTPKAGMAMAMAIHELASNAAKYGALSAGGGRLTVACEAVPDNNDLTLLITWMESGGPLVAEPTRRGFGTTLIEQALNYELDGEVDRKFLPTGLWCTIALPLTHEVGRIENANGDREES